jgi:hypothetical protein
MRPPLPFSLLLVAIIFISPHLRAQHDRFAYAITDINKDGVGWNALRKLDLQSGQYSNVLLNGTDATTVAFEASTKKQLTQTPDARYGTLLQSPFGTGVAAAAYDALHNRLYYTPMFVDQLRYIDLRTMKAYYVTDQPFTRLGNMQTDEGKIITRMVIAPDGYGYAISNDASIMVRFSTGKKVRIEQMGTLIDDASNNNISIHSRNTSFGGDMISDEQGNLYILTAPNHVFKVNTQTKVATHVGTISNLPANFTVNGAVVDASGLLLVSSAVNGNAYYTVNPKDWSAAPFYTANGIYKSSDLANGNFLACNEPKGVTPTQSLSPVEQKVGRIAIYPNPVVSNNVNIQFNNLPAGDYTVALTDVYGRNIQENRLSLTGESSSQTQTMSLNKSLAKGTYMIKVIDRNNQAVYTQKLITR